MALKRGAVRQRVGNAGGAVVCKRLMRQPPHPKLVLQPDSCKSLTVNNELVLAHIFCVLVQMQQVAGVASVFA